MRPSHKPLPSPLATSMEPLIQFHEYCAAYPNLAHRLPSISAWVKTQMGPAEPPGEIALAVTPETYGLTATEGRLAAFLVHGGTLTQYAKRHQLSRHTARNQLQAIFVKLGVNRQADLVRLLIGA